MKVGDLVRVKHTGKVGVITKIQWESTKAWVGGRYWVMVFGNRPKAKAYTYPFLDAQLDLLSKVP